MNPYERQILNDAEEQVLQTQQEFNDATETSGIRPPPDIEETESVLEPQLFGLFFGGEPESEVFPESNSPTDEGCPIFSSVIFSGVSFDCGCEDPGGLFDGAQYIDIDTNDTFSIRHTDCGAGTCLYIPNESRTIYRTDVWVQGFCCKSGSCTFGSDTDCGSIGGFFTQGYTCGPPDPCSGGSLTPITRPSCVGTKSASTDIPFDFILCVSAGLWYLIVPRVFYGTNADVHGTFVNQMLCGHHDWFIPNCCSPGGTTVDYLGVATGGIATLA